jgi:hypothetical protein
MSHWTRSWNSHTSTWRWRAGSDGRAAEGGKPRLPGARPALARQNTIGQHHQCQVAVQAVPAASVAAASPRFPTELSPSAVPLDPVAPTTDRPPADEPAYVPPVPTIVERAALPALGAALLALGTRRTLLYLGAFLMIMSALTLLVFSWASFSATAQAAILAGTAAMLWVGGRWMTTRRDLATAGRNLQTLAALLVPLVAFGFTHPGLLDLPARPAWLFASAVSLIAYLAGAWTSRRLFYAMAAAAATQSSLLALLSTFELATAWQMPPLLLLCMFMLGLARLLQVDQPRVAAGPRWVAHFGAGLAILIALSFVSLTFDETLALAVTLASAAGFYLLCALLDGRAVWMWPTAGLLAFAAEALFVEWGLGLSERAFGYAGLSAAYLGMGALLDRHRWFGQPFLVGSLLFGGIGAGAALDLNTIIQVYPPFIMILLVALSLHHVGTSADVGCSRPIQRGAAAGNGRLAGGSLGRCAG